MGASLCSRFSLDKSIAPAGYIGGLAFVLDLFRMGKLKNGIGYSTSLYILHFGIIVNECCNCPVNSSNQEGERILPAARTRYVIAKYLTMFGVILCGVLLVSSKENKSVYMGMILICTSLNAINEGLNLRLKKENKAREISCYIAGTFGFVVAWLILLGLLHGL